MSDENIECTLPDEAKSIPFTFEKIPALLTYSQGPGKNGRCCVYYVSGKLEMTGILTPYISTCNRIKQTDPVEGPVVLASPLSYTIVTEKGQV